MCMHERSAHVSMCICAFTFDGDFVMETNLYLLLICISGFTHTHTLTHTHSFTHTRVRTHTHKHTLTHTTKHSMYGKADRLNAQNSLFLHFLLLLVLGYKS